MTTRARIALASLAFAASTLASAQAYPTKPIRFIVPYPPGGAADLVARLVSPRMREVLGQPIVIENHGGAGGQIGAQIVAAAPADGHTIMSTVGPAHLLSKFTSKSLPFDPVADFTPITAALATVLVVAANPSFPPNTIAELVAYAKRNPGTVTFGTTAIGGEAHLSMEYIKSLGAVQMTHVPYKGGAPAASDLVGGHIPLLVLPVSTVMEQVKKGSVKVIGVVYPQRLAVLPQAPTVAESLPGFTSQGSWIGVFAPARIPASVATRLHAVIADALNAPEMRAKIESMGLFVVANTPRELSEQIASSMGLYEKLVKAANIQPE